MALPAQTYFNLTYVDPVTGQRTQCSTNCSLTDDPSVTYQDFEVNDDTLASGVRIEISSWYGAGGGLAGVEVFQRGNSCFSLKGIVINSKTTY